MSEEAKERRIVIPVLSFKLPDLVTTESFLNDVPTYANCVSDGTFVSLDGKFNGQPFHVQFPSGYWYNQPNQPLYMRLDLPQHGIRFYERRSGGGGPAYAINYTNQPPEERDEQRRKILISVFHAHIASVKGKFVLDSDPEINADDLQRLQAVSESLVDTVNLYRHIGRVNADKIKASHGAGTLDSLVVPQTE